MSWCKRARRSPRPAGIAPAPARRTSTGATGRAAGDDFYALQRILQGIGAVLVKQDSLSELPPPSATLLLSFWIWNLLPERDRALRAWVEQMSSRGAGA